MKVSSAEFVTSADCLKNCPNFGLPEFAMIGRSNVGKSSFINAISNRKNLARTSNTPGKTRLINFYKFNNKIIIADLPGYGYAKVAQSEQKKWQKNLEEYLLNRDSLVAAIQLIDARIEIQENDLKMRDWLDYNSINVITVVTKIDTLSKNKAFQSAKIISDALNCEIIQFSAKTGIGKDKILAAIENFSKQY